MNDLTAIPIETVRSRYWNTRANRMDPRLDRIGTRAGERLEIVNRQNFPNGENCFVSRYVWESKFLRKRERVLEYVAGGWCWLGSYAVGAWIMTYCGPEKREVVFPGAWTEHADGIARKLEANQ